MNGDNVGLSLQTRASKYGYSNARVFGMAGLLLTSQDIDELIRVKSAAGMLELLQRTGYKDDVKGLAYEDPQSIYIGSVRHFSRIVSKVLS